MLNIEVCWISESIQDGKVYVVAAPEPVILARAWLNEPSSTAPVNSNWDQYRLHGWHMSP